MSSLLDTSIESILGGEVVWLIWGETKIGFEKVITALEDANGKCLVQFIGPSN